MSHSLEFACDVSYKECPRSQDSIPFWIALQRAGFTYVNHRTEENRKRYQESINQYAKYFGQEPIKV